MPLDNTSKHKIMQRIVFDKGNESLEEIIEKITSQDTLEGKISVYAMFKLTRCLQKGTIAAINLYLQIKYPDLWQEIKKVYYPTLFDRAQKQILTKKKPF